MDRFFTEYIFLGIDTIIVGYFYQNYYKRKYTLQRLKNAEIPDVNSKYLPQQILNESDEKLKYVVVTGKVTPLGNPLRSLQAPDTQGVIREETITEHTIRRSAFGHWSEGERMLQDVTNSVPFALKSGRFLIEVVDAVSASYLQLETISDSYEPTSSLGFFDHVFGFFTGVRHRGLQKTEKMLCVGSLLTGIGEISVAENGSSLRLQPPEDGGTMYILTNRSLPSIIKQIESEKQMYRFATVAFGVLGLTLTGFICFRWWKERRERLLKEERKAKYANERRQRRIDARVAGENVQLCVVCQQNPREIILLPCGHVCICEDCSEDIPEFCPVCRAGIESRNAAFIS